MIDIEVDGKAVQAHRGEMLLAVLRRAGISVPTLCHMRDVLPSGVCRLCLVEVDSPGAPELVPSCATQVAAGMKVRTITQRVLRSRKTILELLLAGHAGDCLFCVRNGRCELGALAEQVGVSERRYAGDRTAFALDSSSPVVVRDANKCILCGRCVRVCHDGQGVAAIDFIGRGSSLRVGAAFGGGLNASTCVSCGQCIVACPTGALREQSHAKNVLAAIADDGITTVVQFAPSAAAALAVELGLKAGPDTASLVVAALRDLGFDRVFDTAFAAGLTVMETAAELAGRLERSEHLPLITGCSPAWTRFVEQFYPELAGNLSTCKSPQRMMGAIVKGLLAAREGLDPRCIFSVAITPCAAMKPEARRPGMQDGAWADVDAVLTTRELARIIRTKGLDLASIEPQVADLPFGDGGTAGRVAGTHGIAMEAILRTAHFMVAGRELDRSEVKGLRAAAMSSPSNGLRGVTYAHVRIGKQEVGAAAVSGLANARALLEEIRAGGELFGRIQFIEVMTCPDGCPHTANGDSIRSAAPHRIDRDEAKGLAHANKSIRRLYDEFLGQPLSEKSRRLLHTRHGRKEAAR